MDLKSATKHSPKSLPVDNEVRYKCRPYPDSWPPPPEFPVAIDDAGAPVAFYGQLKWDVSRAVNKTFVFNFENVLATQRKLEEVSYANVDLLKQICLRYLINSGDSCHRTSNVFYAIRPLFKICSQRGIHATQLKKYPLVLNEYFSSIKPSNGGAILKIFYRLLQQAEEIGFVLLSHAELSKLANYFAESRSGQTPYIPPRIWKYQLDRLSEFITDFEAHTEAIEKCYRACAELYNLHPESPPEERFSQYGGHFIGVAGHYGILKLLQKWMEPSETGFDVRTLGSYCTLASYVGLAFILNFSLMRIGDGMKLRSNCLFRELDEKLGPIYMLKGDAVKGGDKNVCWPTSPHVERAVRMNATISTLRLKEAQARGVPGTDADYENPFLFLRPYEPWSTSAKRELMHPFSVRPHQQPYMDVITSYSRLFDVEKLRVTQEDWNLSAAITPTLDHDRFGPGKIWPLAWHQLRRTGAVNMLSSGIVSESSLQYLLKHATRAMALYYGSGFSRLKLESSSENLWVRTMFEMIGKEFEALQSDRFVSPHGEERKQKILELVTEQESERLEALARAGEISYRRNLLGGCTKRGEPCPYGGVDNVARCGGGDGKMPCADLLYDRKRKAQVIELRGVIKMRLEDAEEGSPDEEALKAQLKAVNNALKVIDGRTKQAGGGVSRSVRPS